MTAQEWAELGLAAAALVESRAAARLTPWERVRLDERLQHAVSLAADRYSCGRRRGQVELNGALQAIYQAQQVGPEDEDDPAYD